MWPWRWTFSRKAFGMRMCFKEELEDTLAEKESAKTQCGSDRKNGKPATQVSHLEVLSLPAVLPVV